MNLCQSYGLGTLTGVLSMAIIATLGCGAQSSEQGCSNSDASVGANPCAAAGSAMTGGKSSAGGSVATGGLSASGGKSAAGGAPSAGGASTGGTQLCRNDGSGGTLAPGGTTAIGGAASTGGLVSMGGTLAGGGALGTGGSALNTGGVANGGSSGFQTCQLVPQSGCPGQACDLDLNHLDVAGTTCRAITTPGTEQSTCSTLSDCAAGYLCMGT